MALSTDFTEWGARGSRDHHHGGLHAESVAKNLHSQSRKKAATIFVGAAFLVGGFWQGAEAAAAYVAPWPLSPLATNIVRKKS